MAMTSHLQSVRLQVEGATLEATGAHGASSAAVENSPRSILTQRQTQLRGRLVQAVREALPLVYQAERASAGAEHAYSAVAHILVDLRHQFVTSDGRTADLRGRSRGYRASVRYAYAAAGAASDGPVEKRLSAGVSYWVRKILIERYGEDYLRELGVLSHSPPDVLQKQLSDQRIENPHECMDTIAGLLNLLASDSSFMPTKETMYSAARALALIQTRINRGLAAARSA